MPDIIRFTQSNSSSNSCFIKPTEDNNGGSFNKLKGALKNWRPTYRLIYGTRAIRESIKGILGRKRGTFQHILSTISFFRSSTKILGRPMNITIEPTNVCNLRCPVCETGAGKLGRAPKHMSLEEFKTIIVKVAPYTNTLMLYFMGETFLNKNAYEMISFAKSLGIPFITNCTNGEILDPEKIVRSGLDEISFQIGGLTQETHQIYRINSNLKRVLNNLKETIRFKNQLQSKIKILCGLILMKHNEHEVTLFRETMLQIGVDEAIVIDPCVRTHEEGLKYLPIDKEHWFYDPKAFEEGIVQPRFRPPNACPWIYYSMSIHTNGDVVPCCRDPLGLHVMGNLLTQSLDDVWNGAKFQDFRNRLRKNQRQIEICQLCSAYPASPIK